MKNWFELYANGEKVEAVVPPTPEEPNGGENPTSELALIIGNRYVSAYQSSTNRASSNTNLYLTAGTVVSLTNNTNYNYGIYATGTEEASSGTLLGGGWISQSYTITSDGWYGLALKKTSDANFDFPTESTNLYSYITITPNN